MQLEVNRQDIRDTRTVPCPPAELASGQIRLSVERFALTANNITYGVVGEKIGYSRAPLMFAIHLFQILAIRVL